MDEQRVDLPPERHGRNDHIRRALRLWWRSWLAPELALFRGPWQWVTWGVTAVGLLSVPLLLASGRYALAIGAAMIGGSLALEAVAVRVRDTRRRLATALHLVGLVAIFNLLALYWWADPFDADGPRWPLLAIMIGIPVVRSFWEAWHESAPGPFARAS